VTQTQFIIFCVITFGLLAFAASFLFIDWIGMIARFFRDKEHVGHIEVWNGKGFDVAKGERIRADHFGEMWNYKYAGEWYEVRTGRNYPIIFKARARLIRARPGTLIALDLGRFDQAYDLAGKPYEPQFTEEQLGIQTLGWSIVKLNESVRGKGGAGILIWIMGGLIVLMLIIGGWYYFSHRNNSPAGVNNSPTKTQTISPTTIPPGQIIHPSTTPHAGILEWSDFA
jgi:TM2 domain-containing membrane protein YozV